MVQVNKYHKEINRHLIEADTAYNILDTGVSQESLDILPGFYYKEYISMERFTNDDAENIVDKIWDYISRFFKALYKLSKAVWGKFIELCRKGRKFLGICSKKGNRIKNEMLLGTGEGAKLIKLVREYCDNLIKQGIITDHSLLQYVDLLIDVTGVKTKPFDVQNVSSVRQWIDTLNPLVTVKRIKGLQYNIPEDIWMYYAYNNKYDPISKDIVKLHLDLNNYYFKFAFFAKDYLSQETFTHTLKSVLSGRLGLTPESVADVLTAKLIEPFYKLEAPQFNGNISHERRLDLGNEKLKDIYNKATNKVEGFEQAIMSYIPKMQDAHAQLYLKYSDVNTTIEKQASMIAEIKYTLDNINTNISHLENSKVVSNTNVVSINALYKVFQDVFGKETHDIKDIADVVINLAKRLDNMLSRIYGFMLQLSNVSLKILDTQQTYMDRFIPVLPR